MRWQTVDIFGPLLVNVVYERPLISCIKKQFYVFFGVLEGEEEDLLYGQLQKFEAEIFKTAHRDENQFQFRCLGWQWENTDSNLWPQVSRRRRKKIELPSREWNSL